MPLTFGRIDGVAQAGRWRGFGLTIASPVAIPGALPCTDPATPVDLQISFGSASAPPSLIEHPPYRSAENWLELTVPNICTFTLIGHHELVVTPVASADEPTVVAMLIASGLPMALWASGGLLLHASAVVSPISGAALAIAGPSGAGKSLLLHRLVSEGALSLADDSLRLRQTSAGFSGAGLPGGGYVRSPATETRHFAQFDPAQSRIAAPLGALVVLVAASTTGQLQPLHGQAAMAAVLRHRHRQTAMRLLGREAESFELAALLCRQMPMYALGFNPGDPEPALAAVQALLHAPQSLTA